MGQDYLFENDQWQSEVIFDNGFGKSLSTPLNYDQAKNRLTYQLPDLDQKTKYDLKIYIIKMCIYFFKKTEIFTGLMPEKKTNIG